MHTKDNIKDRTHYKKEEIPMFQYVSNAGIIFNTADKKVGIDCLCKDSSQLYQDTPAQIRKELNLDVLIFTHEHGDHFCAEYTKEAWDKNQNLQIYSTQGTVELLEQVGVSTVNLHKVQGGDTIKIDSLYIEFMKTIHEGEQYSDVQNLTLLINKEDKKLVVTGDAMPCKELFERISNWSSHIDWLFAPFPYVGLRSTRKLMKEYLDIENIFALHLTREEADVKHWAANTKRVCEEAKDGLPQPIFPEKLGEWYCL